MIYDSAHAHIMLYYFTECFTIGLTSDEWMVLYYIQKYRNKEKICSNFVLKCNHTIIKIVMNKNYIIPRLSFKCL